MFIKSAQTEWQHDKTCFSLWLFYSFLFIRTQKYPAAVLTSRLCFGYPVRSLSQSEPRRAGWLFISSSVEMRWRDCADETAVTNQWSVTCEWRCRMSVEVDGAFSGWSEEMSLCRWVMLILGYGNASFNLESFWFTNIRKVVQTEMASTHLSNGDFIFLLSLCRGWEYSDTFIGEWSLLIYDKHCDTMNNTYVRDVKNNFWFLSCKMKTCCLTYVVDSSQTDGDICVSFFTCLVDVYLVHIFIQRQHFSWWAVV